MPRAESLAEPGSGCATIAADEVIRSVRQAADPYARLSSSAQRASCGESKTRLRQRLLASQIRAATRCLIGQGGVNEVTLRRIARQCDLSPQTIYNLVGTRDEVVAAAISEYHAATFSAAHNLTKHPHFLMALADVTWAQSVVSADFIRKLNACYFESSSPVRAAIRTQSTRLIQAELAATSPRLPLYGFKGERLAEAIFGSLALASFNWRTVHNDADLLRQCVLFDVGSLLIAVGGDESGAIRRWIPALN
ncbi:MAG TPA: TetR/AcrR family transcriptional regulator [Steroidobacteraceae bacterium]|nr:TetR/AcrR family transcriptional regulator [Steroidobacteraceae bacterium]